MPHRVPDLPDELREPHTLGPSWLWRFYLWALAIAGLCGFVGGALWIAWRLFRLHVWP